MITTEFILMTAIIVFLLMVIGSILSVREFERLIDESSQRESRRAQAERMHHDNFRLEAPVRQNSTRQR